MIKCTVGNGVNSINVEGSYEDIICDVACLLIGMYRALSEVADEKHGDDFIGCLHRITEREKFLKANELYQGASILIKNEVEENTNV